VTGAKLLAFAELVLDAKSYSTLGAEGHDALSTIVEVIVARRWIEDLTIALEKLIAASVCPPSLDQTQLMDSCQRRNTHTSSLLLDY
jgi:hypothetical protein